MHHTTEIDVPLPDREEVIESREFSDGFGRLLQTRTLAEDVLFGSIAFGEDVLPIDQTQNSTAVGRQRAPGDVPNVVVSGQQTFDNKGRVVEQFEPFFAVGWDYAQPTHAQLGQKTTYFYDARGRQTRAVSPDDSENLTVYGVPADLTQPAEFEPTPWETYAYDANDNAPRTPQADRQCGAYTTHWNTPASTVVDALGRVVEQVARNGADPAKDWIRTRFHYDIRGNLLEVWDPLGRLAFQHVYDLAGQKLRTEHIDAGVQRTVFDAVGNVVEQRDAKGALVLHAYDDLGRRTRLWARDRVAEHMTLRERLLYGDGGQADTGLTRAQASAKNLLGKLYRHYDEAGLVQVDAYDFKGNVIEKARQVISDTNITSVYTTAAASAWNIKAFRIDWQPTPTSSLNAHAAALLDAAVFRVSQRFDALNRLKSQDYPADVSVKRKKLTPHYNRAGALERVELDGEVYVDHIAYNARGQRTLVVLGDRDPTKAGPQLMTRHAYDPKTARLMRLRTEKFSSTASSPWTFTPTGTPLQDLAYEYDLAGNIVAIHDRTPDSGVPGQPDKLDRHFTYDPIYRLLSATGRECDTLLPQPWDSSPRGSDITKTRRYTQVYTYDAAGNLECLGHRLAGTGAALATRYYDVQPGSNRLAAMRVGGVAHQYQYDAAGNIIREHTERRFEWDHASRLRVFGVQPTGAEPSKHAHYLYDAAGERVKKIVRKQGGQYETTVYVDGVFEYHRVVVGGSTQDYNILHVLDNENRIAVIRVGHDPEDSTPAVKFHLSDHIGSSAIIIDQEGNWINREEYTPYGETSFGSFARKRYRFSGKESDEESGLYYFGARYFAPWLGRWINTDPLGVIDGINLYAYTIGNPVSRIDTEGTQSEGLIKYSEVEQAAQACIPSEHVNDVDVEYRNPYDIKYGNPYRGPTISSISPQEQRYTRTIDNTTLTEYEKALLKGITPTPEAFFTHWEELIAWQEYFAELRKWDQELRATAPIKAKVQVFTETDLLNEVSLRGQTAIYLRTDPNGRIRPYIGQARGDIGFGRYEARQAEHRIGLGVEFEFRLLEWVPSELADITEENWIRRGGGPGQLSNKRYQMNEQRYREAGGKLPQPTPNQSRPQPPVSRINLIRQNFRLQRGQRGRGRK
jgi:RHS repeat-associated protein